jgi:hypothetical protein
MKNQLSQDFEKNVESWVRWKLKNFKNIVSWEDKIVYDFVDFLSTYINDELVPSGFIMWASLALYDVMNNKNWFTWKPIEHPVIDYPKDKLATLQNKIPVIAKTIFSEDFSKWVSQVHSEITQKMDEDIKIKNQEIEGLLNMFWWTWFKRENQLEAQENIEMTDKELVDLIHKLRAYIKDLYIHDAWAKRVEDRINEWVNPFHNQTSQWLFLEMYYGSPSYLWTPWGKLQIPWTSSSEWKSIEEEFTKKVKMQELFILLHILQFFIQLNQFFFIFL